MSSFFTLPASQRKRKRTEPATTTPSSKRQGAPSARPKANGTRSVHDREDSISSSESEGDGRRRAPSDEEGGEDESGAEDETAAERRLRLAEQYLKNVRAEAGFDAAGFDAADLDRDIIAERLKEDVAEGKGKLYRRIAAEFEFGKASRSWFKFDCEGINAVAVQGQYAYTAGRDMSLCKWEIATPIYLQEPGSVRTKEGNDRRGSNFTQRRTPKQMFYTRGNKVRAGENDYKRHTGEIMCIAASEDGNFVVTGGKDKRIIVWDAHTMKALRVFPQHRDTVTGVTFRRGTNQLYSCSADRTIKLWSLDELAYIETLFGHQDSVLSITALAAERCVSVGGRDRTARLWKIGEESQLVFRGSDPSSASQKKKKHAPKAAANGTVQDAYQEGSIDSVAMIDDNNFITGSDNGSITLWSVHKKKPVFIYPLAHGLSHPSADEDSETTPHPRWITALASIPFSDVFLSGSWDGHVRAWKIGQDMRSITPLGTLGPDNIPLTNGMHKTVNAPTLGPIKGVINSIGLYERGDRGKEGLCVVVGTGKHWRFGRWEKFGGRNGACVLEVSRAARGESDVNGVDGNGEDEE